MRETNRKGVEMEVGDEGRVERKHYWNGGKKKRVGDEREEWERGGKKEVE